MDEEPDIVQLSEKSWRIQGLVSLDDVERAIKVQLPVDEYETLSGYIFGLYCDIPKDGAKFSIETDDLKIDVTDVQLHTVKSCIVTLKEQKKPENKEG